MSLPQNKILNVDVSMHKSCLEYLDKEWYVNILPTDAIMRKVQVYYKKGLIKLFNIITATGGLREN